MDLMDGWLASSAPVVAVEMAVMAARRNLVASCAKWSQNTGNEMEREKSKRSLD